MLDLKKKVVIFLSLLILIGCVVFGYNVYKKVHLKNEVLNYLINEKNVDKKDIEDIESFYSKLVGDKKYLVYVKLKGDDKKYYYYQDSKGNILLESYSFNGVSY